MSLSWARNSVLVNSTSTMPVQLTKLVMSASVTVRPMVLNCRPTGRSSKNSPRPTVSICTRSSRHAALDFWVVIGVVPIGLPVGVGDWRPARRVAGPGAGRQAFDDLVEPRPEKERDRVAVAADGRQGPVRGRFEAAIGPAPHHVAGIDCKGTR